ncbi:MAG TPA: TOBE domain-containing protein [Gemmatimonadales bacterium]|nr:TOBE domain-containing protein [Gemmatimonadales bacterium]
MDLMDTGDASRYLKLNPKRIQALARDGRLPGRRVGRKWLFARQDLDRLLGAEPPAGAGLDLSARNQLRGTISALTIDGVMAEVHLQIGDQSLVSIITRGSAERLRLEVGDSVLAVIKSTEIMIGRSGSAS